MGSSRTWIKVYVEKLLFGSLRQETPAMRGIWLDVLCLAGGSSFADDGQIKLTPSVGYTDQQIADIIVVHMDEWLEAKQKLVETERIFVDDRNIITICNWSKYQSEYRRQKPYRQDKKKREDVIQSRFPQCTYKGECDSCPILKKKNGGCRVQKDVLKFKEWMKENPEETQQLIEQNEGEGEGE